MNKLELNILGGLSARIGGEPVSFPTRNCALLLAYLALMPERSETREKLASLFWGDRGDRQARSSLRQTIYRMKQTLDALDCPVLIADQNFVRLNEEYLWCDCTAFEAAIASDGEKPDGSLDLYRGDLLAGAAPSDPAFDGWLRDERLRLRRRAAEGLHEQAESLQRERRFAEMEATARKLVALDEYNEAAWRLVMTACDLQGRRNEALAAYRRLADMLADQLGVSPDTDTTRLFEQVRDREAGQREQAAPGDPAETETPAVAGTADTVVSPDDSRDAAGAAERRNVSVLAIHLGAVIITEEQDPEESAAAIAPLASDIAEVAAVFDGFCYPLAGDECLLLFGTGAAQEDHIERACRAAIAIAERFNEHARPAMAAFGVDTGAAVIRPPAEAVRLEGIASGAVLPSAKRIARQAPDGHLALSANAYRRVAGLFGVASAQSDDNSESVHFLDLTTANLGEAIASNRRVFSDFSGRSSEMEELQRALDRVRNGPGEIVSVVGEAGIGKSRLIREFLHDLENNDIGVLRTGATSYGVESPYHAIGTLLRNWLAVEVSHSRDRVVGALRARLAALGMPPDAVETPLRFLLGLPLADARWQELAPGQRRARTIEAIRRVLAHESRVRTTVLVFEDLHWIDAETQTVLDALVDDLPGIRLLVVATQRPEYAHNWMGRSFFRMIRVGALSDGEAEQLIQSVLGRDNSLAPVRGLLLQRCGGIPLFLEETVRELAESGVLSGQPGAYRLAGQPDDRYVPASVRDVLAARVDRLTVEQKTLLQLGSVIGIRLPLALLRYLAGLDDTELQRGLAGLRAAEMIFQTKWQPEVEYEFKHALTLDAVYETLLKERRAELHARLVDAIETVYAGRLNEHIERLAHHAEQGALWSKAVAYLRRAGDAAIALSAYGQARNFMTRAVAAADRLPKGTGADQAAIETRLGLRPVLVPSGEFDLALRYIEEAESLATAARNDEALASANVHKSYLLSTHGKLPAAIDAAQAAIAAGTRIRTESLRKEAVLALAQACSLCAMSKRTIELLLPVQDFWQSEHRHDRFGQTGTRSIWCQAWLGNAYSQLGRFEQAARHAAEGHRIAAETGRPVDILFAHHRRGTMLFQQGDIEGAIADLESAHAMATETDAVIFKPWVAADLGRAYAAMGILKDARRLLNEAITGAGALGLLQFEGFGQAYRAQAELPDGDLQTADRLAHAAADRSQVVGDAQLEIVANRLLGQVQMLQGNGSGIETLRKSVARAEELGLLPELARSRTALARFTAQAEAKREADVAQRIAQECGLLPDSLGLHW